jgi:UDP-arabinose 4-epimerase
MSTILVVGGAGFIGSHTCKALAAAGHRPVVFDNMVTGNRRAVRWGPLVEGDIRDRPALDRAIGAHRPDAVIHFAAHAYVGESVSDPAKYYSNNVEGTLTLLAAMLGSGLKTLVFSSSCATYGVPAALPIDESTRLEPINPYGWSKRMVEQILVDYSAAYGLSFVALRYFNACGADPDGELGEWHDPETHLIPRALLAAAGRIPHLDVFGNDYPTPDGTCVRDYVHVADLAAAHVLALDYLAANGGAHQINIGPGAGASILEVLATIDRVVGRRVPTRILPRRAGDPAVLVADPAQARTKLGFQARHSDMATIIRTAWPFFS